MEAIVYREAAVLCLVVYGREVDDDERVRRAERAWVK